MIKSDGSRYTLSLVIIFAAFVAVASISFPSKARTPTTAVNIVNNSTRAIVNVYLSHTDADDWSGNQLGDATISPGQSFDLNNVACDRQQVKVIGEDQDGCFVSTVLTCGGSSTWTISSDTPRDCGQ